MSKAAYSRLFAQVAIVALLIIGLFATPPSGATAAQQSTGPLGQIRVLATDASGKGWAFADTYNIGAAGGSLLRIENGAWRVVADSASRPDLITEDLYMVRMVLNDWGDNGWAIGQDVALQQPVLWRLQNGAWSRVALDLPPNARLLSDITISSSGGSGWIAVHNPAHAAEYLLRLHEGKWERVEMPEGMGLEFISLSPSGHDGWATGYINGEARMFRLVAGTWTPLPGWTVPAETYLAGVGTQDGGNGWAVSTRREPDKRIGVIRLRNDAAPRLALEVAPPHDLQPDEAVDLWTSNVALRGDQGEGDVSRGWIGGEFSTVRSGTPRLEYNIRSVLIYLNGESATQVTNSSVGAHRDNVGIWGISSGGTTWVGGQDEQRGGYLAPIHEPWPYQQPAAAAPLLSGQTICFEQVPYCLRGDFAFYWKYSGGLNLLGYPISTEVSETLDGKQYLVQYTERARLEYHPENVGTPYSVLLGLLGNTLVNPRLSENPFKVAAKQNCSGCIWFSETEHNIAPPFAAYWQNGAGVKVYGLPRSEAFNEKNAADGKTYQVQYFERNRIEYHPENRGTEYEFQLGLLGVEQFAKTYGYAP